MANQAASSSAPPVTLITKSSQRCFLFNLPKFLTRIFINHVNQQQRQQEDLLYGAESGWVEARTSCDHLPSLSSDLAHIPTPDTPCHTCQHPEENWLCLCCKEVLCSRFVNKHMLNHYHHANHSLALSYSDLSVWCFACDAYLDAQVIQQLRPVYETAYILKFGEAPPFRSI
ncbi:Histone deacetylase superfamily [Trema orientale]|uniref:Histone deacetylase superfamily n=1 Tax=Trema orientale TaxID=63057 RepID=A0A2P5EYF7_TREOI|nr:Histone deacetylase superfamily [Trema orientale]